MSGRQWRRGVSATVLAALVGTGGAVVAEAQQGTAAVGPGWQQQFSTLDRNGDNRLDRSELQAAQGATFANLDADGDGRITAGEAAAAGDRMDPWIVDRGSGQPFVPPQQPAAPGTGPGYGPGVTSGPGADTGAGERMPPGMGAGPGMGLGPGHGPGMMQGPQGRRFSRMDMDRDGVVTRREFDTRHRTMINRFDANRDGYVSPDEFADAMPAWRRQ